MTLEHETGVKLFERQNRLVLSTPMVAINGRIQQEGDVVQLVAQRLFYLSEDLGQLGERGEAFPLPDGRGDEFAHGYGAPIRESARRLPRRFGIILSLIC